MKVHITTFQWHEFFPQAKNNIGVVIALWAPIIIVYFMDTQIWYAIFSTIFGVIYGAFRGLGEIRTLVMLRSRFQSLPGAFNACLIPEERDEKIKKKVTSSSKFDENPSNKGKNAAQFAQLWNRIISSFREEDLITNWIIDEIFLKVDNHIEKEDLIKELNMSALPGLYEQFIKLIEYLLENRKEDKDQVVIVLLNMLEIVTRDIWRKRFLESSHGGYHGKDEGMKPLDQQSQFFGELGFPVKRETEAWKEKIKRLHLLLTVKESAMDVPSNLEARRRISFFSNSLFMDMPTAPKVRNMLSFS
uniref:Callose synthase helical domain-containing protein n=1 Tax=Fagus sylvatica TaxID=28930 RepID=A0A2N9I3G5_FAGSY